MSLVVGVAAGQHWNDRRRQIEENVCWFPKLRGLVGAVPLVAVNNVILDVLFCSNYRVGDQFTNKCEM